MSMPSGLAKGLLQLTYMNEKSIIKFAERYDLTPVAFFRINYPAYSVKIKYKVPTNDPLDFMQRALLRLIGAGISYKEASALLLINDPHNSILKKFKNDDPVLVAFNHSKNRDDLTPLGRGRVERVVLTKSITVSGFVDGTTGEPFPMDMVENLENSRFHYEDIGYVPNADYPFDPEVESKLKKLETDLLESKTKNSKKRLRLPAKAVEIGISLLEGVWITDLSMGIFIKAGEVKRYIFCGNSDNVVSPFGYLQNPDAVSLFADPKNKTLTPRVFQDPVPTVFEGSHEGIRGLVFDSLTKLYGPSQISSHNVKVDMFTGLTEVHIDKISGSKKQRARLLNDIENGATDSGCRFLRVKLPALHGVIYVKADVSAQIGAISQMKQKMVKDAMNWKHQVAMVKKEYPDSWRQVLLDIGRKDLLFMHDKENFIKYHHGRL